jgi:hypothetical protein
MPDCPDAREQAEESAEARRKLPVGGREAQIDAGNAQISADSVRWRSAPGRSLGAS